MDFLLCSALLFDLIHSELTHSYHSVSKYSWLTSLHSPLKANLLSKSLSHSLL